MNSPNQQRQFSNGILNNTIDDKGRNSCATDPNRLRNFAQSLLQAQYQHSAQLREQVYR